MDTNLKFSCVLEVAFCESQGNTDKLYHYFAPDYIKRDWKPGDLAVTYGQGGRKCLVEVKSVIALDADNRATRPVIGYADISAHQNREAEHKRRDELVAKLEEMDAARRERQRWAELAGTSEEAKNVLAELVALDAKL